MLIALHKGRGFISKLIQWQTRSEYSHASLVLDDGRVVEAREFKGVRVLDRLPEDEAIDLFKIHNRDGSDLQPEQSKAIEEWALSQVGKPYDYTMVARFISRRQASRKEGGRWFCSEFDYVAVQKGAINLLERIEPWRVAPAHLGISPLLTLVQSL